MYRRLDKKTAQQLLEVEAHDRDAKIACIFIVVCKELTGRSIISIVRIYFSDDKLIKVLDNRWRKYYQSFKPLQLDVALICEKVREIGC